MIGQFDFIFEPALWEAVFSELPTGGSFSAVQFLSLMEPESEETVEHAFQLLERKDVLLDVSELSGSYGAGEAAIRLRREEQLVKEATLLSALEQNDPLRLYLEELAEQPAVSEPQELAERYLAGDEAVLPLLMNVLLRQVVSLACGYTGYGVLLMDMIQEGSLSLWQALHGYSGEDLEKDLSRTIHRAIAKSIVLQARSDGIGRRLRQSMQDYRTVDERLLSELGRNPTLEEIAEQLHMSPEEASSVADALSAASMMEKARTGSDAKEEPEQEQLAVEDTAYFQMRQRIQELLSSLSDQDASLLSLRFGLEGGLSLSPADAGKRLGLTKEEVLVKEAAALEKLRNNK